MSTVTNDVSYPDSAPQAEHDLHDRLEVALLRVGALHLGRAGAWRYDDLAAPYWRLYCNRQDGARIHTRHRGPMPLMAQRRYLIPPWVHFASEGAAGVDHIYCHFDCLGLSGVLLRELFPQPVALRRDAAAEAALITTGDALAQRRSVGLDLACAFKAAVFTALGELLGALPAVHRHRVLAQIRRDLPVRDAVEWIEQHLHADLSNASIAARLHVGSDQAIRLFRRWLGQTPAAYVQERRIAAVARRLAYTDEPIDTIAAACGFANRHYLTRIFGQHMGLAPAAYRRVHAENEVRKSGSPEVQKSPVRGH